MTVTMPPSWTSTASMCPSPSTSAVASAVEVERGHGARVDADRVIDGREIARGVAVEDGRHAARGDDGEVEPGLRVEIAERHASTVGHGQDRAVDETARASLEPVHAVGGQG